MHMSKLNALLLAIGVAQAGLPYEIVGSGKTCQDKLYYIPGRYDQPSQCAHPTLLEMECDGEYFDYNTYTKQCRCNKRGTTCDIQRESDRVTLYRVTASFTKFRYFKRARCPGGSAHLCNHPVYEKCVRTAKALCASTNCRYIFIQREASGSRIPFLLYGHEVGAACMEDKAITPAHWDLYIGDIQHMGYTGCYKNAGSARVNGHVMDKTLGECVALAAKAGKHYFGMEWPQASEAGTGQAQCLLLDHAEYTKMSKTSDADCEVDGRLFGDRLGGHNRLAVYKAIPDWVYNGCYKNEGSVRVRGHVWDKSLDECVELAKKAGKYYAGMEYPQGSPSAGEAQCLLLDEAEYTKMTRTDDAACEVEGLFNGDRLGGGSRLAVYRVKSDDHFKCKGFKRAKCVNKGCTWNSTLKMCFEYTSMQPTCSKGTSQILDAAACHQAATTLDMTYVEFSSEYYPKGCISVGRGRDTTILFNTDGTGSLGSSHNHMLICSTAGARRRSEGENLELLAAPALRAFGDRTFELEQ